MKPFAEIAERIGIRGQEIIAARTYTSKLYDVGNGKRRLVGCMAPIHYTLNGSDFDEIDLTPRDDGDAWIIDRAPFIVRIARDRPFVTYEGRVSGKKATFAHPGRMPVDFEGRRALWRLDSVKDIAAELRPAALRIETWLKDATADPEYRWVATGLDEALRAEDADLNRAELNGRRFTGRVSKQVDRQTRKREWKAEPAWPVRVF